MSKQKTKKKQKEDNKETVGIIVDKSFDLVAILVDFVPLLPEFNKVRKQSKRDNYG